jgi:ATPases of the AAA+ class
LEQKFHNLLLKVLYQVLYLEYCLLLQERHYGKFVSSPLFEATHLEITSPSSNDEEEKRGTSSQKEIPQDTWDDLAGIEDIKEELMDVIKSQFDINTRKALSKMNITPPRGILLFGPPGTGKTKIARIIAHEANASFFAVSGTEFTSMWYGQSEANLRAIFEEAYRNRPVCVAFR